MRVVYAQQAIAQLEALYAYIAADSGPMRAKAFLDSITAYCDGFETFPERGMRRDDIRPGLRIVGFRRRVTITFTVEPEIVTILGVFYGGQDVDTAFDE